MLCILPVCQQQLGTSLTCQPQNHTSVSPHATQTHQGTEMFQHTILKCYLFSGQNFPTNHLSSVSNILIFIMAIVSKYLLGGRFYLISPFLFKFMYLTWVNYLHRWEIFLKPNKHSYFRNLNYSVIHRKLISWVPRIVTKAWGNEREM